MFTPPVLGFDVEADLKVCTVIRPVSVLVSFIVFLIHLAIIPGHWFKEVKSAGSDMNIKGFDNI